jgi:hypothetical protein
VTTIRAPKPRARPQRAAPARQGAPARRKPRRRGRRRLSRRTRLYRWLTSRQNWRRWRKRWRGLPATLRTITLIAATIVLAISVNWIYQVIRKPTELFFPVSGVLLKTPQETWASYGPLFRRHSTSVMTPDLLAALAQVEGSGNPVARTYWRMSLAANPFDIYRPASSAVGMYQITDGTFEIARRYCVHDNRVVEDGPWDDRHSCWFNAFYSRVIPSHAVEMTSAYLDRQVRSVLARAGIRQASLAQQQRLAAVIHLCGAGAGAVYARRGLGFAPGQRCGSHDPRHYVAKVAAMQRTFAALAAR